MTILVEASLKCTGNCSYCYNKDIRNKVEENLDLEKIVEQMSKFRGNTFCLHGGEPLILPFEVLERLCMEASRLGRAHIQSSLIGFKKEHLDLFKKYDVKVGVSLDGFGELNKFRGNDPDITWDRAMKLREYGLCNGFLIVVSRANGLPEQREEMKNFILQIHNVGLQARLLPCRHPDLRYQLTIDEMKEFYSDILDFMIENNIRGWSPYADIALATRGEWGRVWCRFSGCDPFATKGGIVITAEGKITTCHKFKDKRYYRLPDRRDTRANLLLQTDCKGCKWFKYCRGGCPGDAIDFDWRNKTYWCEVWKMLFEKLGKGGLVAY